MSKLMTAFALITKKEDKRGFQKAIADNITKTDMLQRMSDTAYLKLIYRLIFGRKLDLKNPQTFNEKLQWLKLNDRKTEYTTMVDKYEVKKYIEEKIVEEYVYNLGNSAEVGAKYIVQAVQEQIKKQKNNKL